MKGKIKLLVLTVLSLIGVFAATASAGACWFWSYKQKEAVKPLLPFLELVRISFFFHQI